ncbi:MAG: type 1 glutamine amidotransferase [Rhodothermales bacterium]|jgi:type 1 glutamine amidotransferase
MINRLSSLALVGLFAATLLSAKPPKDINEKLEAAIPKDAAKPKKDRKVLIFTKTAGFRHGSIATAIVALTQLGEKTGAYTATHSEDEAMFEPESLQTFDAVFMINTTGDIFRSKKNPDKEREERLKKSLVDFVKGGGGLAGTHSATDTYKKWKEYNDMMGGAFAGHPWHMDVPIANLAPTHILNAAFNGEGFTVNDEIYQFRNDTAAASDRKMLLALDADWDGIKKGKRDDGLFAISWCREYGDGRTFYCSLGHRDEIYWNPTVLQHYLAGFQYVLGDIDADATPGN